MSDLVDPSSAAFFEAKYQSDVDPWAFESDPYELARYQTIVGHVDPARHNRAFEPGCSVGVLTQLLGRRCMFVDATDLSAHAVRRARHRCRHLPGVTVTVGGLQPVADSYDLIVLSEVGYYLGVEELRKAIIDLARRTTPNGRLIAAHWIGTSPDHRLHGDDVHDLIGETLHGWRHHLNGVHRDPTKVGYRLDIWDRP